MKTPALSLYLIDDPVAVPSLRRMDALLPAGFPSPADDYLEDRIDLNRELVQNPTSTFLARVRGDSMRDAHLQDGDLILIDRSQVPGSGSMVLAWIDGGFTVKHLILQKDRALLRAANPDYPDLELNEEEDNRIWGVVTHVIHREGNPTPKKNMNIEHSTQNIQH
ncbi:translesion error-prone DNA polymerase V autoproteolytic subunit [Kiritimatiellaeota bacterium B1221]|nr:translesion error-prone DNA polymerase V autoproteolytic subunit [Kiritimatiellaeota bacterium B1221]